MEKRIENIVKREKFRPSRDQVYSADNETNSAAIVRLYHEAREEREMHNNAIYSSPEYLNSQIN